MSKLMVIPSDLDIKKYKDADAFLFGIENLSVNYPMSVTIQDLKKLKTDKEVFVSVNKNMHNKDIPLLRSTLEELDKLNIKGVFFYDTAVFNIKKEQNLKFDLVWAQEHFLTNSNSANYWYDLGVKYGLVASEITKEEILEIATSSKMALITPIFGYQPMFVSARPLVRNYLKYFDLSTKNDTFSLEKEGFTYPIEDGLNTVVYSSYILNGLKENIDTEYLLLNSFRIDPEKFLKVLSNYKNKGNEEEIKKLFDNTDLGFLHKETVYKVKKNG